MNLQDALRDAERGDARAQYSLGEKFYYGLDTALNYAEAAKWYQKAAEQGLSLAQNKLGYIYHEGLGVRENWVQRFRKEFAQYASDCISFAIGFLDSVKEPQDHGFDPRRPDSDDADDDFADAEGPGHAPETANVAPQDRSVVTGESPVSAVQGGSGPDDASHYADDLESLRKAAERGDVKAQVALGDKYCTGDGVTRDYREALEWYLKAAEQGNAEAQNSLGYMYDAGRGVRQDYAEALRWYRKAADQGNAAAACNLGSMYYSGQGVRQSYGEAYRWYRVAADLGSASAAGNLKYMLGAGLVP